MNTTLSESQQNKAIQIAREIFGTAENTESAKDLLEYPLDSVSREICTLIDRETETRRLLLESKSQPLSETQIALVCFEAFSASEAFRDDLTTDNEMGFETAEAFFAKLGSLLFLSIVENDDRKQTLASDLVHAWSYGSYENPSGKSVCAE